MPTWSAFGRRALVRAVIVASGCITTPAAACPSMTMAELVQELPGVARFELGNEVLRPLQALWRQLRGAELHDSPDGVTVLAQPGRLLLVAFHEADCLIGLLPTEPELLWRVLREQVGPIA